MSADGPDLAAEARALLDENAYMTLATADADGRPWASPVWYAPDGYATLYWVSSPETTHSRNLAVRPELAIVVFDSRAPVGSARAVYLSAGAALVTGADLDRGIEVFSRRSQAQGRRAWTSADVEGSAPLRLYRATVSAHSVLVRAGQPPFRRPLDSREPVEP